jgi:hypothetical protein
MGDNIRSAVSFSNSLDEEEIGGSIESKARSFEVNSGGYTGELIPVLKKE